MVPVSLVRLKMVSLAGLRLPSQECFLALETIDMEKGDLMLYVGRKGAVQQQLMVLEKPQSKTAHSSFNP